MDLQKTKYTIYTHLLFKIFSYVQFDFQDVQLLMSTFWKFSYEKQKISEKELGKWVLEAYWTNNFNITIRICIFGLEFGIEELWASNKKRFHLQYRIE